MSHQWRFFDAQAARDRHLVRVLHLEHAHAVDVLGDEAGVVERELDGLDGGVGDRPADVLGERQMADADDGDPVLDAAEEVVGHDPPGYHAVSAPPSRAAFTARASVR